MLQVTSRTEAALVVALTLAAPVALADQWQFNPRAEVGGETDSNYLLLPPPSRAPSVSGGFGNVLLELRNYGEVNEFRFAPGVYATYFPNGKDEQSTDPYAYLDLTHHGQESTAKLVADFYDQSTAFSERLSSDVGAGGLGNPTGGDSGFLAVRNRRQTIHASPSYESRVSPLSHLTAQLDYYGVSYDKSVLNTYVGYRAVTGAVGWVHDLSERTSLAVRARYSHFRPDGATGTNSSTGLEGEWTERVSGKSQAYARIGAQRARFDQVAAGQSDRTTSIFGGIGMNWSFQVTQVYLDLTRTIDPNSSGYTVERNQLLGRVTRDLAPLLRGYVGAVALKQKAQQSGTSFSDRTYAVGTVGLEWRFMRAWTLVGAYNYTRQKFAVDTFAANSNAATVSVVYEPNRDRSTVRPFGRTRAY